MIGNWFIAEIPGEVGQSYIDFFSIGHLCGGIAIFLFFSLLYTIPMSKEEGTSQVYLPLWAVWIITVAIGILWELLENTILYDLGLKFEFRLDSLQNLVMDIIFVAVGAASSWVFAHLLFRYHKSPWPYYVFGIINVILWLGVFVIWRYTTLG
ncbi:MAG: membrane protein of unknown function [Promethearchaeota archaeon]|nr:MAG: membrane protein of unknown function [Candidatus Lokiarchaeota archaeon]